MKPVLIVENEIKFCKVIQAALELDAIPSEYVTSAEAALTWLKEKQTDIVLTDLKMDGLSGMDLLQQVKTDLPEIEVIMMTAFATQKTAVDALKIGAFDYLIKPFEMDELILRIKRIIKQKEVLNENRRLKSGTDKLRKFDLIIGRSAKMQKIYELIEKAAAADATVLVRGESGTGKELVVQVIHSQSNRNMQPFVAINCAALPENLLESELFGHEKGAFTGAIQRKPGKFEVANNGSIFLDEIGDMSLSTQAKLLRVLQNKEIYRLGGTENIKINTRVITATHKNLEEMVASGTFRQDLFYRLNVFPIVVPPLRERKEDIPELINHFIQQTGILGIDNAAVQNLMDYDWPGNIRELQNIIERASIMADSIIMLENLPALNISQQTRTFDYNLPDSGFELDEFEKFLIRQALERSGNNKTQAAEILGITRRRLYSMMERYTIQ